MPAELVYGQRMTAMLARVYPNASDDVRLAVRASTSADGSAARELPDGSLRLPALAQGSRPQARRGPARS